MGNFIWFVPADEPENQERLTTNRWLFVLFPLQATSMAAVIVRNYRNSKFAYLYTVATMMFLSPVFSLI